MQFIQGNNRHQTYFSTLENQVCTDNPVRLMDAFIDKLDLQKLGFTNTIHKSEGRPPYAPAVLLKLYMYGYTNDGKALHQAATQAKENLQLKKDDTLMVLADKGYHTGGLNL